MRVSLCLLAALLGVHLSAVSAAAEETPGGARFAVHIQPHVTGKGVSPCDESPVESLQPCSTYTTHGDVGNGYDLYVVIGQGDSTGIGGATFGITYNGLHGEGIDVIGDWILCASGLEFPSAGWPASGTGNVLTWNPQTGCATTVIAGEGVHATAGFLYVFAYGEDRFAITPHMKLDSGPALLVADCTSREIPVPEYLAGYVDFGGDPALNPGYNPCAPVPTRRTTWGQLKTKY